MAVLPILAIFDIGKTNKKLLIFDSNYQLVEQRTQRVEETADKDGFPCDDLAAIESFVFSGLDFILEQEAWELTGVNFSAYGASLVYIDASGKALTPLYNYLKPYPDSLAETLLNRYGGLEEWSAETASPFLGSLNSGLQLYRFKTEAPDLYRCTSYALHLPQYLSYLLTGKAFSEFTSIGCHTGLWNYKKHNYHEWVLKEGLTEKLAPIVPSSHKEQVNYKGRNFWCGVGLHDSSAALVPYMEAASQPFALLSTGTWCITLNPYNSQPLTREELAADCLSYLSYKGNQIKAARLFGGQEHENQVARIASCFGTTAEELINTSIDPHFEPAGPVTGIDLPASAALIDSISFRYRNPASFMHAKQAYHQLIYDLVYVQIRSLQLVCGAETNLLYLDGGFVHNKLFLHFLQTQLPDTRVEIAPFSQASAIGAALALGALC
ncbi:FGGY family carbohydrate kinase [Flavihumibacter sp. CACIAM 22H1]|uniref:FGGY-family carbohydrate kinase n=1 Tax=Flavihumibacter sp. CACIAM 22H1 TaxID=1812911 RepID=UPI0007A7DED5|nr:FGGY family carbohydrate kinase [Flavihumibacter sp. CACIAM 22H1]KYP15434.1 MAG: hypothetical protein A1D16_13000 [Flavihumibacter sp. CACIAM 22H1]